MPAAADTRAPLSRRRTPVVLLGALGAGLAGLALPGGAVAPAPSVVTAVAAVEAEPLPHPPVVQRAVVPAAARPRSRVARATRSRPAGPRWVRPVAAGVVSPYGMRWGRLHPGVDFGARYGAPIHAVGDGVVIGAGYLAGESGYGQLILIRHAGGVVTAYAHTSKLLVHAGERVHAGDVIGRVGATGHVTGPHLHFEVRLGGRKVNPVPWLRAHGIRV